MRPVRLIILLLVPFSLWGQSSLTFVQGTQGAANATSAALAYGSHPGNNSLLVATCIVSGGSGTVFAGTPISDTIGNTWVQAGTGFSNSTGQWKIFYVAKNSTSAADTVTCFGNGSTTFTDIGIVEYTGQIQTTSPLDVGGTALLGAGSSTTINFPSITTTFTNETLLAWGRPNAGASDSITPGAGYTVRLTAGAVTALEAMADTNKSSPGTYTTSWTMGLSTSNNISNLVAFRSVNSALPSSAQSYVTIIKYNPMRDSIPRFKPELIFTVLRRWQRPCEPIRFL